ncbi:MAG TPA: sodium:solute symporter [Longimicrobiales bacterium]|nr:sodium:solute symporter [Longimicrobiales bacterium]
MSGLGAVDLAVIAAYLLGVVGLGAAAGGRQETTRDYFLGGSGLPWWAIALSVVATETSALTFISVPAVSYGGDLWFLQLGAGYLVGRVAVAALLLPGYFRGDFLTAYAFLESRFGASTRRFASVTFLLTRALGDSVRLFAAAIPVALLTGLPYTVAIVLAGGATLAYTYRGGLRSVVWVDVAQMALYVVGGVIALVLLGRAVPGGWAEILSIGGEAGRLRVLHLTGGPASGEWLVTGLVGGGFLSLASHGVDHLIVQRLLAAGGLSAARKAVVWSGVLVLLQFTLFLFVGVGLFAYYGGRPFATNDEVLATFVIERFPPGLAGLIVAALLAAAMSTVSSSLNALASSTTLDLYGPLTGRSGAQLMAAGRLFTVVWAIALTGGALLFQLAASDTPIVVIALQVASFTYGGLLGAYLLGLFVRRSRERDVIPAMATAVVGMTVLWIGERAGVSPVAFHGLWFAALGSAVTLTVGWALSTRTRGNEPSPGAGGGRRLG